MCAVLLCPTMVAALLGCLSTMCDRYLPVPLTIDLPEQRVRVTCSVHVVLDARHQQNLPVAEQPTPHGQCAHEPRGAHVAALAEHGVVSILDGGDERGDRLLLTGPWIERDVRDRRWAFYALLVDVTHVVRPHAQSQPCRGVGAEQLTQVGAVLA